ncbi:MAG: AsmA family protein [Woeseiaceae bacterium]|nr:AsmA family protein [Woeseiaceae bacterium]
MAEARAHPGRWRRIAFWTGLGLVSFVVLVLTWLWTADLGLMRPQIESWVADKTGRKLAIGRLSVDLAATSIVVAEDVRFANADWADDDTMVEIGYLELHVDLRSLFRGPIVIDLLDINDASVHLERRADGVSSWTIASAPDADDAGSGYEGFEVLFRRVDVDRVSVVHMSHERSRPLELVLERFDQVLNDNEYLELGLDGTFGGQSLSARGQLGTWSALLVGTDVRYDLEGQFDTITWTSSGHIDDLIVPSRPSIEFAVNGPAIDDLTRLLGIGEEGEGDIGLEGSLLPLTDGPLELDVAGNIGQTTVEARGRFSDLQHLQDVDIDLLASGPDLGRILGLAGIHQVREAPFMIDVNARRSGPMFVIEQADMVFGEAEFDLSAELPAFPTVDDARIRLNIEGPDIGRFRYVMRLPGVATGAFKLGFELGVRDDGVEVANLDLTTSLGHLRADGVLGEAPRYVGTTLDFLVESENLARLGGAYGLDKLPEVPIDIRGSARLDEEGIRTVGPLLLDSYDVTASVEGLVALTSGVVGSRLSFGVNGPNLSQLVNAFADVAAIPDEPYSVAGILEVGGDGFRFRNVEGEIGTSTVKADGLLTTSARIAGSRFDVQAEGPAFEEIIDEIGNLEVRNGWYELSGRIGFEAGALSIDGLELVRERGDLELDLDLGLPVSARRADFKLGGSGKDVRALLSGVEGFEADEAPYDLRTSGEWRGSLVEFDRFDVAIGDATASAKGQLDFGRDASRTRFVFSGSIPSLSSVGTINDYRMRPQPLDWDLTVSGGQGELRIDDIDLKLGDSDINGSVLYDVSGDVPSLDINVSSNSIVFVPLMELREHDYDPEPEFKDGRMIADLPVPWEAMGSLDASVDIDVGELERDSLYLRNVRIAASLNEGILNVADVSFDARAGRLRARAVLDPDDGVGYADVELVARDFAFGAAETNQGLKMTGDIDIKLESSGNDLRTLAANANGVVRLDTNGGELRNNRIMQALYGDMLQEIIGVINPFARTQQVTELDCVVLPLALDDGVLTAQPNAAIRTTRMTIAAKAEIDLATEKLQMTFRTMPRKGISISTAELFNPYVKVVGELSRPTLAVDEQGVLITGGAAVATGGLSILAKAAWDRMTRGGNPCEKTAKESTELLAERMPDLELEDLTVSQE